MDSDATRGLYRKYRVERTDGSSAKGGKHEHCEYFVLDLVHDSHAVPALERYAESCADEYPELYDDLNDKIAKISKSRFCSFGGHCDEPGVIPLGNGCRFCVEHGRQTHDRYQKSGLDGGIGPRGEAALRRRGAFAPPAPQTAKPCATCGGTGKMGRWIPGTANREDMPCPACSPAAEEGKR